MKTVSDGRRRFVLGWLSTRSGDRDAGHRQWGGDLVVHEIARRQDGTLGVLPVEEILHQFRVEPVAATPRLGQWSADGAGWRFDGSSAGFLSFGEMDDACLLDVTLDITEASELAVVLRADAGLEHGYYLRLEPDRERVVFDRRPHHIFTPFEPESDRAYVKAPDFEIQRPFRVADGAVRVRVIVDGSAVIAYVNDVALSTRAYDLPSGEWGVVVAEGAAHVRTASIGRLV
jgi:beta-fructofuranosidase